MSDYTFLDKVYIGKINNLHKRVAELEKELTELSYFVEPHAQGALGRRLTADEMISERKHFVESLEDQIDELENHKSLLHDALHYSTFVVDPISPFFDTYLNKIQKAVDAGAISANFMKGHNE